MTISRNQNVAVEEEEGQGVPAATKPGPARAPVLLRLYLGLLPAPPAVTWCELCTSARKATGDLILKGRRSGL